MGFPNADDVERLSQAVATKSAIEEAEYRQNHGVARSSSGGSGAKFVGSVPLKSGSGGWFARKAIDSGYNLTISADLPNGSLVEYESGAKNYYGKITKNDEGGAIAEEITEVEAEKIKKENKVQVVKLTRKNISKTDSKNPITKILYGIGGFLFPSEDDSVDAFLITFIRLIAIVAFVMIVAFLIASAI